MKNSFNILVYTLAVIAFGISLNYALAQPQTGVYAGEMTYTGSIDDAKSLCYKQPVGMTDPDRIFLDTEYPNKEELIAKLSSINKNDMCDCYFQTLETKYGRDNVIKNYFNPTLDSNDLKFKCFAKIIGQPDLPTPAEIFLKSIYTNKKK